MKWLWKCLRFLVYEYLKFYKRNKNGIESAISEIIHLSLSYYDKCTVSEITDSFIVNDTTSNSI